MTSPGDLVRSLFEHHLWATERLIGHLAGLSEERLRGSVPGTYGSMLATLTHMIDADSRYLMRLDDPYPSPYEDRGEVALDQLLAELPEHRQRWEDALGRLEAGELHAEIRGRDDYPDTDPAEGMLLLQAIHHGNDHRAQICSTLGALGEEVPDLDGWEFWVLER